MSVISRVADRRYVAKKLFSARKQARAGNWGFAEVYIDVARHFSRISDEDETLASVATRFFTRVQLENCVRMMCRHETRKHYTRVGKGI